MEAEVNDGRVIYLKIIVFLSSNVMTLRKKDLGLLKVK